MITISNNKIDIDYDERYNKGYMKNYWKEEKKNKIKFILGTMSLKNKGTLLDYGCGNGEITKILKNCLPDWNIYGFDISKNAIQQIKNKKGIFFDISIPKIKFDLIFSHHTLEHIIDLKRTKLIFKNYIDKRGKMLHILPCGNVGSFEYNIAKKNNWIIENNKFKFESKSHIQRFSTETFSKFLGKNFKLIDEFYSNQHYGAINSIMQRDLISVMKLQQIDLVIMWFWKRVSKKYSNKLKKLALWEWDNKKKKRNGTEMFLIYGKK